VWAIKGAGGVLKQRRRLHRIALICAQKPRNKTISCKGQSRLALACPTRGQRRAGLLALRCAGRPQPDPGAPHLECIFGHTPLFSKRWDTVRYSGIQLDTARYGVNPIDTGIHIQRDTKDAVRYGRNTG